MSSTLLGDNYLYFSLKNIQIGRGSKINKWKYIREADSVPLQRSAQVAMGT